MEKDGTGGFIRKMLDLTPKQVGALALWLCFMFANVAALYANIVITTVNREARERETLEVRVTLLERFLAPPKTKEENP